MVHAKYVTQRSNIFGRQSESFLDENEVLLQMADRAMGEWQHQALCVLVAQMPSILKTNWVSIW